MTHRLRTAMNNRVQTLAVALAIGAAVLSLPVMSPRAEAGDPNGGVRCQVTLPDGELAHYKPGQAGWDKFTGTYQTCGKDGTWQVEGATQTPAAPRPAGVVLDAM